MSSPPAPAVGSKQYKVWTLMATTLVVGLLLAFGRWASDDRHTMFGHVAWHAFPAGWVLAIEYGLLSLMIAAVIRADRVDTFFASSETLTWLGGICLFTLGLYHDGGGVWVASIRGYGTFTQFLRNPSLAKLPLLLTIWPMAYGAIAVSTSFVAFMGGKRPFLHWRWILHAAFLVAVTASWIMFVLWPGNLKVDSRWLAGSLVVLPFLAITLALVRAPDRKIHWMNLIAVIWLLTDFYPRFNTGQGPMVVYWRGTLLFVLGPLLILGGSIGGLFSKAEPPRRQPRIQPRLANYAPHTK